MRTPNTVLRMSVCACEVSHAHGEDDIHVAMSYKLY